MNVIARLPCVAQQAAGMDVAGREHVLLVVKATYAFPETPGETAQPAARQRPLVMADEFTGEPGFSATLWESDFAFRKHRCDVVAHGVAYAPGGRPAPRVPVGIRVGRWQKAFEVVGYREWRVVGPAVMSTDPHPFLRVGFSYDTAFGGTDRLDESDKLPPAYLPNPVGRGFASSKNERRLSGQPLPNTEEPGVEVTSPYGQYRPMAFGPLARSAPQRLRYAGTYDTHWEQEIFPFLPPDFDERYYQSAPEDQQIDPPAPGTEVVLVNLTSRGKEAFRLPDTNLPVVLFRGREVVLSRTLRPDTLAIDTEAREFTLAWRVDAPIRRTIAEFTAAWVGPPSRAMLRAYRSGKEYRAMRALDLPEPEEPEEEGTG